MILPFALVLLNASLTFENIWPTPAVKWRGQLSLELAVCVLALAAIVRWRRQLSPWLLRGLAVLWVVLIIGHYADVTAPAIFGRPINLYWDGRHLSAVADMLATSASAWLVIAVIAVVILIPLLLYLPARWALGRLGAAIADARTRRVLVPIAVALVLLFLVQPLTVDLPGVPRFSTPVLEAYGSQGRMFVREMMRGPKQLPPAPALSSDLSRIAGADVFVVFVESYGAVSYDRPGFVTALAASRARLEADIHATGRRVVSAYVESPTFGGSSWLAHVSLLTGTEVRDEDTNIALMAGKRRTLVSAFAQHGFRTVALMPGLQQVWPEGAFYNFDEVYRGNTLDYRGPDFGWWSVPDQYSIARLDALEVRPETRAPLFVFFPTISTHTPFSPIAPYQPDWNRVLTDMPYDEPDLERAYDEEPDWMNLGPSYVHSLTYDFASIGGYLRLRADRDFVMILIGDHQPPAAVSGEGARWDVPVHVIASRADVLDRLIGHGFREGLTPPQPAVAPMHVLTTMLLESFGDSRAE